MSWEYYNINPQEFLIENREVFGNNVRYDLVPSRICLCCPSCGSANFIKHGSSDRKVRDLSEFGNLVGLVIKIHRYLCKSCGNTWSDSFESIRENAKMTNRMRDYVRQKSLQEPFLHISKELDISVSTVRRVFLEYCAELDGKRSIVAPKVLGMDENFLNGKYRALYVDIGNIRIIDMTEDRKLRTVKRWLSNLPHKEKIECVTIDMWGSYKEAVEIELPGVPIVIDKFHVIKHVNEAMDAIRKGIRDQLTTAERKYIKNNRWLMLRNSKDLDYSGQMRLHSLLQGFPQFKEPYDLKESFRDIYNTESRKDAEKIFQEWSQKAVAYPQYAEVVEMIENWHHEIFNYFDYHYTNAATESLNKIAKEIAARGRGYTYDVLRMKLLHGTKASKPAKYEYYPQGSSDDLIQEPIISSGVDINELLDVLQDEGI